MPTTTFRRSLAAWRRHCSLLSSNRIRPVDTVLLANERCAQRKPVCVKEVPFFPATTRGDRASRLKWHTRAGNVLFLRDVAAFDSANDAGRHFKMTTGIICAAECCVSKWETEAKNTTSRLRSAAKNSSNCYR